MNFDHTLNFSSLAAGVGYSVTSPKVMPSLVTILRRNRNKGNTYELWYLGKNKSFFLRDIDKHEYHASMNIFRKNIGL